MLNDYSDTVYPGGLEKTPRKYAIIKRNQWMIEQADTVVTEANESRTHYGLGCRLFPSAVLKFLKGESLPANLYLRRRKKGG